MTIDVREATPGEWDEAGRVTAEAFREFVRDDDWEAYLRRIADIRGRAAHTTILVAIAEGKILGSLTLELEQRVEPEDDPALHPGEAHVRMLGVDPDERGRGIAAALMVEGERRARAAGKTFITLHTTERMHAAQAMYAKLGYVRGRDRVLGHGFVLLSYSRDLETGS